MNGPEPASRVWLARDDISEWKQWVLLRLAPYHWQRAGGSRLCKPKSLLLLECSALGASSRTVGPQGHPAKRRLVYETLRSKGHLQLSTQNGTASDRDDPRAIIVAAMAQGTTEITAT